MAAEEDLEELLAAAEVEDEAALLVAEEEQAVQTTGSTRRSPSLSPKLASSQPVSRPSEQQLPLRFFAELSADLE